MSTYEYMLGGGLILCFVLGCVILYRLILLHGKKKEREINGYDEYLQKSANEEYPQLLENTKSNDEIIIVGAGVAGSALAYALAKDGRRVHVIERDLTEPDRIVGELLQPGGYMKLIDLDLQDCVEDIDAQRMVGYVICNDGKTTILPYPRENFPIDLAARTFHNGRFVQRLREKAASHPNVRMEQGTVTSLIEENGIIKGVKYKTNTAQELTEHAPLTIICDGCFSNLRRFLCSSKVEVYSCIVGWVLKNFQLPYANHAYLVLANPSVVTFYHISSTEVRCFVNIPSKKPLSISNGEMSHYLKTIVAPQIPPELYYAFISTINERNMRIMQGKNMIASPYKTPGALLLGDALNIRHPITGGGMTVALSDVVVLRDVLRHLRDLNDASALLKSSQYFYNLRKPKVFWITTMASLACNALCAPLDEAKKELRQLCFGYLSIGGVFTHGPLALLSGLNPHPLSFVPLFTIAVILTFGHILLPFPSLKRILMMARLHLGIWSIIFHYFKG